MAAIILFDGVCNLCHSSVQFIIKRDQQGYFKFASIQGDVGQKLLQEYNLKNNIDSIVLIEKRKAFIKSSAALRTASKLQGGWKLLVLLLLVPVPVRNFFYDWIAHNRYRWFGKQDSCMIPSPSMKERFLE
ncbi:thiol-disulfide oxidoreductase [Bacillus canaveralius]|uniref:Thiol-disulfide oxidoreductase n=1 Tax=Bacillus canaveralius TaxID=1403243 RepID=A0A2N5GIK7_9BACI|nr:MULTISPECIES: DCC1-like thiol-disulfide oxidoreductase family protein [Bacillus]PLR80792.1 thiol-disulfide oxidoreductase [Bacillus canaveralius]PLR81901.1 thiol-disulfide oxidoreductase [Bacillus sp. V33-4]PLR98330.1 thiol-disulfide oxidoreductase [Bacillus canaveralius]